MRFLVDAGVDVRVARWLHDEGHDAVHLRDEGLQSMADAGVFQKAHDEDRILLTFDLDFGEILALTRAARPSVVLFRLRDARHASVTRRLADVLAQSREALERGCVAIVEEARHRVRPLPIGDEPSAR